jgi:hypothetical protein
MSSSSLPGWDRLRHGGLLLDTPRLQVVAQLTPPPLAFPHEQELRRQAAAMLAGDGDPSSFVAFVLERICGFSLGIGAWLRGSAVGAEWSRRTPTGETVKPRHLWRGSHGAIVPVFLDNEKHVGIGRGKRTASQVVQWLRAGTERLAVLTNGRQWRLIFAGLDFDAWCEWDIDLWFEDGELSPQVDALRTLVAPRTWTPPGENQHSPLLAAVLDSRKGQAELSAALGERVREAVELLVQAHGEVLLERCAAVDPAEIYRAAVRLVMRIVVVLFAESRDLLPRDNALYHGAYGIGGLLEELEKAAARGGNRLARSYSAWPRLLALFRLVYQGSHHPALPVPAYGGELYTPAAADGESSEDGIDQALRVFETAAFDTSRAIFSDRDVHRLLEKISRTRVRLRQGRQSTWVTVPVDFSDLSSEYIGILYEGLLDFELKTAPSGDPVIFLAVGNQPALPLSRLESMDDKALAALLEKMKDTSSKDKDDSGEEEEEEDDEADDTDEEAGESNVDTEDSPTEDGEADAATESGDGDHRHITRSRAEQWARRAVEAGKLTPRPRGKLTPEKRRSYDEAVASKAHQLIVRVVLPGEWFLVRWGGTRKGSGTFYTRPGLAVPTVQRTLRPLAYAPPMTADGTADADAPARDWSPRLPEEILALKVCDPACGSGTFPVVALRYLTDALYAAVHHHGRVTARGDRSVVSLLGPPSAESGDVAALGQELVPCRPDDPTFEPRLKAVLKRQVAERCIYGIDIDPLAAELCRLALWIETMDRSLPFSFLDHKIKCGNGLVGAWFDQFLHYPVMAWKNREGGDKSHSNGVHFGKGERGRLLKEFAKESVAPDLRRLLEGRTLFSEDLLNQATAVHEDALAALSRLHDLPVHDCAERARLYRDEIVGSATYKALKSAMDLWCACWFWPADELDDAPLPTTFALVSPRTQGTADRLAARYRFFHWELEFPDVFRASAAGFDAVVGNPPWDVAKPNSKEFFSNLDPLFRGLGDPETRQTELFADPAVERRWLDYCDGYVAWSNYVRCASSPFGDPENPSSGDTFSIAKGSANGTLHGKWRAARAMGHGFSDPSHPFRSQGGSDLNMYKLFTEQMVRLLRVGGAVGVVLPAALYNDNGSGPLRRLILEQCGLQWLFSFENRAKIFPIDSRFRFCCVVARRGSPGSAVRMAFSRREIAEWAEAERIVITVAKDDLNRFSPISNSILEVESTHDLDVLRTLFDRMSVLGGEEADAWGLKYFREYDMTQARKAGQYVAADPSLAGTTAIGPGHWQSGDKSYVAFYTGKMVAPFDFAFQKWIAGHGQQAVWEPVQFKDKNWFPEFVTPSDAIKRPWRGGTRLVFRDMTNATNERTMLASVIPGWPCGNKVPLLAEQGQVPVAQQLALCCVLNSFAYDFVVRNRMTGINLNKFIIDETPVPDLNAIPIELSAIGARLCMVHDVFAGPWLELLEACPALAEQAWQDLWAIDTANRLELRAISDAIVAHLYGLNEDQFRWILRDCDYPKDVLASVAFRASLPAKGFWRTGVGSAEHPWRKAWKCDPEFRLPNLALVAFIELDRLKKSLKNDLRSAVAAFAPGNGRGGWKLPDRLRLSDYGLGHTPREQVEQELGAFLHRELAVGGTGRQSWEDCRRIATRLRIFWDAADSETVPKMATATGRGHPSRRVRGPDQPRLF